MARLRVHAFSLSLDGFGAGPDQALKDPLGVGGESLHEWAVATNTFRGMYGQEGGEIGPDDDFVQRGFEGIGAWILGRNMFGPIRGPWPDEKWRGWWGEDPPYHVPVFVLTHHARPTLRMNGGTEFHFVTSDIRETLRLAFEAARGRDVRLGGGVSTIRQYLEAKLVDEMHLAIAPVLLGKGEHLLHGLDLPALGYQQVEHVPTARAMHVVVRKK